MNSDFLFIQFDTILWVQIETIYKNQRRFLRLTYFKVFKNSENF